jgi:hypothetical protein
MGRSAARKVAMSEAILGMATQEAGPQAVEYWATASSRLSPSAPQKPMVTSTTISALRRPGVRSPMKPAFS